MWGGETWRKAAIFQRSHVPVTSLTRVLPPSNTWKRRQKVTGSHSSPVAWEAMEAMEAMDQAGTPNLEEVSLISASYSFFASACVVNSRSIRVDSQKKTSGSQANCPSSTKTFWRICSFGSWKSFTLGRRGKKSKFNWPITKKIFQLMYWYFYPVRGCVVLHTRCLLFSLWNRTQECHSSHGVHRPEEASEVFHEDQLTTPKSKA